MPTARGLIVFLTGLPGAGKSTLARALHRRLTELGRTVTLLDGDEVRALLSSELGYSRAHRDLNVLRIGYVAAEIARHGGIAICAQIAPYAAARAEVRRRGSAAGDFLLVHVATPIDVCERRDPKGHYAKARAGLLPAFTGVSDPYEPPQDADLTIDTQDCTPQDAAQTIVARLRRDGRLD
ncbi:MAG: adenylyl-sulfate kinase [Betaproteobacteria bacterium]|nr:MAG: adenylyl-sulfate kinase [Betaproteobacteria bacterium]